MFRRQENCCCVGCLVTLENHLAEVVRSKPGRPTYRGKNHIPPLFGPIGVPYLKGLNCLFTPLQNLFFCPINAPPNEFWVWDPSKLSPGKLVGPPCTPCLAPCTMHCTGAPATTALLPAELCVLHLFSRQCGPPGRFWLVWRRCTPFLSGKDPPAQHRPIWRLTEMVGVLRRAAYGSGTCRHLYTARYHRNASDVGQGQGCAECLAYGMGGGEAGGGGMRAKKSLCT